MIAKSLLRKLEKMSFFPWFVCSLGALFYCYEYFLRITPSVMTQDLMRVHHIGAQAFGNLAAFYYYAYTPMQLPVGVLMDRFGPRRLLLLAILCCIWGSLLFASPHYLWLAQMGRFLVGFGSAFAFVGTLKLASIWLAPSRFALVSGLVTTLGMAGAVGGDVALASLVQQHGWRETTLYSGLAGSALLVLTFLFIWDQRTGLKDKPVAASTPEPIDLLAGVADLWLLARRRVIWINGLIGSLLFMPVSVFAELWGVRYLERAYGFGPQGAASAIALIFVGWAVGAPIIGFLSDKIQQRRLPLILGALSSTIIMFCLLLLPNLPKPLLSILLFLLGLTSSAQILVFPVARELSHKAVTGTALALTNMIVMLGGVFFQPLVGVLLDQFGDPRLVNGVFTYHVNDYRLALFCMPVCLLFAAVLPFFLPETHGK